MKQLLPLHEKHLRSGDDLLEMLSMIFLPKLESWTIWQISSNSAIRSSYLEKSLDLFPLFFYFRQFS